jgi:hypothetical protein
MKYLDHVSSFFFNTMKKKNLLEKEKKMLVKAVKSRVANEVPSQ